MFPATVKIVADNGDGTFTDDQGRQWHHEGSYYTTSGVDHVQFMCADCGADLNQTYDHQHCWDCMAKFCKKCWGYCGLGHDFKHHTTSKPELSFREIGTMTPREIESCLK